MASKHLRGLVSSRALDHRKFAKSKRLKASQGPKKVVFETVNNGAQSDVTVENRESSIMTHLTNECRKKKPLK